MDIKRNLGQCLLYKYKKSYVYNISLVYPLESSAKESFIRRNIPITILFLSNLKR